MSTDTASLQTSKIITLLQSEEKKRRSEALKQVLHLLKSDQPKEDPSKCNESSNSSKLWDSISKPLLRILNDPVEECRDLTLEILQLFIEDSPPDDKYINYLFPILSRRLGSSEQIETSEEVRLKSVVLIKTIITKYKELLSSYVDDLTTILVNTVKDNYPIVKKESCESIQAFAEHLTRLFYYQSKNFVKPVLHNFSHQHYRVRAIAVKTIGEVIQFGDGKLVDEVVQPLAERLFDQNGIVRKAVIEVAGSWLLKLRDRYSWWHRIIPLLLTGLHDELEEIRMISAELWKQVGLQYMKENETDEKLKDKMDFLTENLRHYPKVGRPNLGCRTIAQQSFGKLLNGMIMELSDWIADIRVKAAQLLCVFVLHLEEDITQHIAKILGPMYRGCNDEDKRVVENLERACEYMGHFVLPKTYFSLIVPTLEENLSVGHLRVFSSILKGSERSKLKPFLKDVGHFLAQPHICQSKNGEYQGQLLACCSSLILVCDEDLKPITQDLFNLLFTVLSMSKRDCIKSESEQLLNTLSTMNSISVDALYEQNLPQLFSNLSDNKSWTVHSPDFEIFSSGFVYVKQVLLNNIEVAFPILKETISTEREPELRLKLYILLSQYFEKLALNETIDPRYCDQFLEHCILSNLIWSAGRSAEAVRTACVCCLCTFLDKYSEYSEELSRTMKFEAVSTILDKTVPILLSLAEDNSTKTRFYSIRALYLVTLVKKQYNYHQDDCVNKIYPVLLKRLDDGSDDVRVIALEALTEVSRAVSGEYDVKFNRGLVDALYTTVVIYLDDPDGQFQEKVLASLKELAKLHPELLHDKLQKCKTNFRYQKGIESLIEHCQSILINK